MGQCFGLVLGALLAFSLQAQNLSDRFRDGRVAWEMALDKGDGTSVRKSTEALLQKEGLTVNPSDYNEMHALVAVRNLAARACVLEGAWEDGVAYLEKAAAAATENATNAEATLSRIRKQHDDKLMDWRDNLAKQEARCQELDALTGLTAEQMKLRQDLRKVVDEHRNAIAHSERSLKTIDEVLAQIRKEQQTYEKSLADWQGFLAKERSDLQQVGGAAKYVAEKLEQVKADDAKPLFERLAYGRRLLRLDPQNAECRRFVDDLLGLESGEEAPARTPAKRKPRKKG